MNAKDKTFAEPDLSAADTYVEHLADLGEIQTIVASEDIYNEFGALLIPKGAKIKKQTAERLLGHKLEKSADEVISMEECIRAGGLYEEFERYIDHYPDLQALHVYQEFENTLRHLCTVKELPRTMLQKLTVMRECMPEVYRRTLFCAWLGSMIAQKMGLDSGQIYEVFLTALYHDLGLLHIKVDLVEKTANYTDSEWQAIEAHVLISKKIVEQYTHCSNDVTKGVVEHHERCDGTGYPSGKTKDKLHAYGMIVGMCDALHHIRCRQFEKVGKTLAQLRPYLQINTETFSTAVYRATFDLVRSLPEEGIGDKKTTNIQPHALKKTNGYLKELVKLLNAITDSLSEIDRPKIKNLIVSPIENISTIVLRSSLVDDEIDQWLADMQASDVEEYSRELEDMEAMQHELLWLIRRVARVVFSKMLVDDDVIKSSQYVSIQQYTETIDNKLTAVWDAYGS